jgi:replication factor C subunit 1
VKNLYEWLRDWDEVHIQGYKKELPKSRGNWQNLPNLNAKAALVSGPPGIGKTSAARIICKSLGFESLEMNASDCRNKLAIQTQVGTLSGNRSIDYFTTAGIKK